MIKRDITLQIPTMQADSYSNCYGLPFLPSHGSMFSGIGGFDLAAERAGFINVFNCEWNEFGQTILKYYWENAEQYGDITQTDFNVWRGRLNVLSGGFPCQDISIAGKKLGLAGQRSGMFYQNIRATEEARPKCAIWENVGEVINYLPEIISAYAEIGYCLSWHTVHAGWFGLPHERKRIYGIAFDTNCFGFNEVQNVARNIEKEIYKTSRRELSGAISRKVQHQDYTGFMREDNGIPTQLHFESIKAFGNAVVPQIPELIFGQLALLF